MLLSNHRTVTAMTYRKTLIASLGVLALVLATSETFADPGPVRGAGAAPSRPAFPSRPGMHQSHRGFDHHRGFDRHRGFGGFGGVFYGLPDDGPAVVEAPQPPLKQSDDLRFTCVYDIPWDYVHRCPQFSR
jgi:hypothetical protein